MFCLVKQASTALYVFVPDSESVHAAGRSELREAEDWIRATGAACEEICQLVALADAHISLIHLHQYDPVHPPFPQTQVMWPDLNGGFNTHTHGPVFWLHKPNWRPGIDSKGSCAVCNSKHGHCSCINTNPCSLSASFSCIILKILHNHSVICSLSTSHCVCSLEPTDCSTWTLMFSGKKILVFFADHRLLGVSLLGTDGHRHFFEQSDRPTSLNPAHPHTLSSMVWYLHVGVKFKQKN